MEGRNELLTASHATRFQSRFKPLRHILQISAIKSARRSTHPARKSVFAHLLRSKFGTIADQAGTSIFRGRSLCADFPGQRAP